MSSHDLNPFDDLIVIEPRRREAVVSGLNDRPLRALLGHFAQLTDGAFPRPPRRLPQAQLVISEQPGYGKSHLISRLFRELHQRATLVYVRPLQNPATAFQSLMLAVVRELNFPDRAELAPWDAEEATQLDRFAHAVLAHLLADLIENGHGLEIDAPPGTAEKLRADPLAAFNRGAEGDVWAGWMRANFPALLRFFEAALVRRGVDLVHPGWLRVLFAYAFSPFEPATRMAALDWMTAQSLSAQDTAGLGLRAADGVDAEVSAEQASDLCRTRLTDLCQLACLFRPFVFCFDQTEIYGHQPPLARAFGMIIAALVNEAPNHLTLVTANQTPWQKRITPSIERADLQRFEQPPIMLEGLTRGQAEELVRLRFAGWPSPPDAMAAFLNASWLAQLFPTERNQMGTRLFLQKCRERWARQPLVAPALAELFEQRREQLLAEPKRHLFEPDTLQWLVEEGARDHPDLVVEPLRSAYFRVRWLTAERTCFFGFEGGAHWKRWQTIARDIQLRAEREPVKAVFFRTPELPPIPGAWQVAEEIEAVKASCLEIVALSVEEIAELYAARELFADAAQGDIAFSTEEIVIFLHTRLAPWWTRLRGPIGETTAAAARPDDARVAAEVREIVERARFIRLEDVSPQLSAPATRDDVLRACGLTPEIRVSAQAETTVLQWQSA